MEILKNLHSYFAYIVLVILILAVVNALMGLLGKREFTMHKDLRISLFALILTHIQLLIGLILYFVSANGLQAIQTLGMGGLNSAARLLAVEHPFINILAVALIRARGFRPCFSPNSLLPISSAAAPSTMPEELPAW